MAFIDTTTMWTGCGSPAVPTPDSVAGAIAGIVGESGSVEVFVVGAGTLNQCVKAIAIDDRQRRVPTQTHVAVD